MNKEQDKLVISEVMGDFVVVRPFTPQEKVTESGLFVAPTRNLIRNRGEVVKAGPGHYEGDRFVRSPFKVGEKVLFHHSSPYEIEENGETLFILKGHDIILKLGN